MRECINGPARGPAALQQLLAALVLLAAPGLVQGAEDSSTCVDLGFTGMQLCSDCNTLGDFVKDEGLVAECKRCCAKDSKKSKLKDVKFTSGMLEICQCKMGHYPNVNDFITKHEKEFGDRFTVSYKSGAPPKLKFENEEGDKDSIRIDNWKVEDIYTYVKAKMVAAE